MEKHIIVTGKTVEEAVANGCEQLGVTADRVEIDVIDRPKKSFLGLKFTPAKVKVTYKLSKSQIACEYLMEILEKIGLSGVTIDVKEEENAATLVLNGEGLGVVIGRRGETLDALQYLVGLVINRVDGDYFRITIDSGNFREKREKTLEALAKKLATTAIKTGRSSTLEPMNPYERRIIHAAVQTVEGAVSTSVGDEPNRRVVISSKARSSRPYNRPYQNRAPGAERTEGGEQRSYPPRAPREGGHTDRPERSGPRPGMDRGPRRPRPEPYQPTSVRATPPSEAVNAPLYGKIEPQKEEE